jgi:hypothetical protein
VNPSDVHNVGLTKKVGFHRFADPCPGLDRPGWRHSLRPTIVGMDRMGSQAEKTRRAGWLATLLGG